MGISVRQHLASLVAVFLALLIGVLVGVALTRQPGLEKQINQLTSAVARRDAQDRLSNDVARGFADRLVPGLVRGKLAGRKAAVFVTATSLGGTARGAVEDALELAGAEVVTRTEFDTRFVRRCSDDREKLVTELGLGADAKQNIADAVVRRVVQVATGGGSDRRALGRGGLFGIRRLADGKPTLAVVVGGSDVLEPERLEYLDLPLIRHLKSSPGMEYVVGCEACDVLESVMRAYQKEDISTIDHVDVAAGRFSLVLALAGADGHYGMKAGADRPFPEIPEQP